MPEVGCNEAIATVAEALGIIKKLIAKDVKIKNKNVNCLILS
jgi:hypothetical protein